MKQWADNIFLGFGGYEWLVCPSSIPMVDISLLQNMFKKKKARNIIQAFGVSQIVPRGKLCSRRIQVSDTHMLVTSISWLQIKLQKVVTFREQ